MVQTKEALVICDATDAIPVRSAHVSYADAVAADEAQVVSVGTVSATTPVGPERANHVGRATVVVAAAGSGEEDGPLGVAGVVGAEQVAGGVSSQPSAADV